VVVVGVVVVVVSCQQGNITEWPPKWFLKLSAADLPLQCMVLLWLFFVLVLSEAVLVLVLDRFCDCIIPFWSTRCSGRNLVMDRLAEIRSMIRELGNGGLWAVTKVALFVDRDQADLTDISDGRGGFGFGFDP
jgi:hypothetical protein